ncbi:hypothetical protein Axi01nite_23570 [Actinoplanes xinjiangensis]|nr:hypothetical protein Axi01nite_23570 [Actinoplanes xinjiangensis]
MARAISTVNSRSLVCTIGAPGVLDGHYRVPTVAVPGDRHTRSEYPGIDPYRIKENLRKRVRKTVIERRYDGHQHRSDQGK